MPKIPAVSKDEREVLYPEPSAMIYDESEPLTFELAEQLLGCVYPDEKEGAFADYLYKDVSHRTVFCGNVNMQRPYYAKNSRELMYEILSGYWELNLESIIIGRTGLVLDGKHRLIALLNAVLEYRRNPENYPLWKSDPVLHTLVAFGGQETRRVVNTIGIGKYRSLADSLYASNIVQGQDLSPKTIKLTCKTLEFATRLLWHRTGAVNDAYNPRIRHSEALDFLERHPHLHHCTKTIIEENQGKERRIQRFIPLGAAVGLMYLMASRSEDDAYHSMDYPDESGLTFDRMETAEDYWLKLVKSDPEVVPVTKLISKLFNDGNQRLEARVAAIVHGWNAFANVGTITPADVKLNTKVDKDGIWHLTEVPCVINSIDHFPTA